MFHDEQDCRIGTIPKTYDLGGAKQIHRMQGDKKQAIEITLRDGSILAFSLDSGKFLTCFAGQIAGTFAVGLVAFASPCTVVSVFYFDHFLCFHS